MKPATHPSAVRIRDLLAAAGIASNVVEFEHSVRTSKEAADAIGCSPAEIAKTIVFRAPADDGAVLVIASGDNRVSEAKIAALLGEDIGRADADFVRATTGYVIGGVSPVGHAKPVRIFLDQDLQRFEIVWAAAGTPYAVFPIAPSALKDLTGVPWSDVRLD